MARRGRALTFRLGVALRFGQEQPAQRGEEQQGPHSQGLETFGRLSGAHRPETSRRGQRSPCHALDPPWGRCHTAPLLLPAALPRGKDFPVDLPKQRPLQIGAAPSGLSGSSRVLPPARPPRSLLKGATLRSGRGRERRDNNFYSPEFAPSLDR